MSIINGMLFQGLVVTQMALGSLPVNKMPYLVKQDVTSRIAADWHQIKSLPQRNIVLTARDWPHKKHGYAVTNRFGLLPESNLLSRTRSRNRRGKDKDKAMHSN